MSKSTNSDHATTDRLSERAHESVDRIARTSGKAEERIRHEAGEAKTHAKEIGRETKERSGKTMQAISGFVQGNPLISLGLAFAAGMVLSASRRKS